MDELCTLLKQTDLLAPFSLHTLEGVLLPRGRVAEYPKDATMFYPQDRVSQVQVLLRGKVHLLYFMSDGKVDLRNALAPLSIVGLDLICTRTQISPYQAVAAEPCVLFSFPVSLLLEPGVLPEGERLSALNQLLISLSHMNMQKEYRLAILTHNSLRERILVYLTMQAARRHTLSFSIPFSRDEMASFLSVNRSALSHELSLLRQEGVLDFHKNHFTLLQYQLPQEPRISI